MLIQKRNTMNWQELRNAFRELIRSIRSIDRDQISDPRQVIRELKKTLRSIVSAGKTKIGELREAIQNLKNAIQSIIIDQMPDMQNVFNSIGEWWLDLRNIMHGMFSNINMVSWSQIGEKARNDFKDRVNLTIDKVVEIIAALGVPGLVLIMLMAASPWYGAAAMTSSLAVLGGPFGMAGGLAALPVLGLIARALAKFGFKQVFQAVLIKLMDDGKTIEEILEKIDSYPMSKELKRKLKELIEKYSEESDEEKDDIENNEKINDIENDEEKDDIENNEKMNDIENDEENSNE